MLCYAFRWDVSWRNRENKIFLPFCADSCNCSAFPPLCIAEQSSELWAKAVVVNLLHHSREDSFYLPGLGILPWVKHVWASCMIPCTRCHLLGGDHSSWEGGMILSQVPNPSYPRWAACKCQHVCRLSMAMAELQKYCRMGFRLIVLLQSRVIHSNNGKKEV